MFLLGLLTLLAGLASEAAAQITWSSTTITRGETKTFTVTGIPASWTGTPRVTIQGGTANVGTTCTFLFAPTDVCRGTQSWDSTTRTHTFTLRARSTSDTNVETFTVRIQDQDDTSRMQTRTFEVGPDLPSVTFSGVTTMKEGQTALLNVNLSEKATSVCSVKVKARRADGSVWNSTAVIAAGKQAGKVPVTHNNDSVWQESGWYNMPVWTAPSDVPCYANVGESNAAYFIRVTDDGDPRPNRPPKFPRVLLSTQFPENSAGDQEVLFGAPLPSAMDPDGDTLTYTLAPSEYGDATDPDAFLWDADAHRITTKSGVTYDYETKASYRIEWIVNDGRGGTHFLHLTITLRDVDEPPSAPAVTAVNPTPGSNTSLDVSWTAPDNTGKPPIDSYDLRYRAGSAGDWINGPQDVSGTSSQITGLHSGTAYQVQVRATNDEGDGDWSSAGSGMTSGSLTPVATFASATSTAGEGAGTQNVTVNLSPAPQSAITLSYTVGGTATAGTDFSITNSGSVQVSANATSVNIPVAITDDTDDEEAETVILTLGSGTGYTVGSESVHTLTITDNDDPEPNTPVVSITGNPSSMTEGGTATFTLTASPAPTENISVSVQVADSGNFAASGQTDARTVAVDSSGTADFTVATVDDGADEPGGTIRATVRPGTGYSPHGTNGSASVTVNDNDDPPTNTPVVSIAGSPPTLTEGGTATFTLTANPAPTGNISVAVTVAGGNFATSGARTVTVGTLGTATFTVVTDDDETDEPNGTITATVNTGTGYSPHNTNSRASVTVNDNDAGSTTDDEATDAVSIAAVSTLALTDATVSEGESVTVRLTVTPPAPQALTITWRTQPGTATAGTDYPSEATGTVTIPAGAATATFTLATTADRIAEPSETFTVTLAGDLPAHVTVADGGATATITIEDDDIAGVTLTPATLHLREAGETAPLTVRLTSQPTAAVTVTVTSAPAAVATVTPATLTFTAATWATPQPVTVTAGTAGAATLTLTLASADPGYATLTTRPAARVRVGADLAALTTPWLARFGRTVTGQAVTGLTTRLTATRTPGLTGSVAGLTLSRLGEEAPAANQARLAPSPDVTPDPRRNPGGRLLTGRDLLAGSAFALTSAPTATGGSYALWGQGAWTHFAGHTGAQAVNGEVLSGTLGVDWAQGPWVLGVAVSHTQGEGDATERTHHGTVQSSLTLVTPYVGLDVTDHVTLWGTVGYGRGTLTLTLPTEPEVATDTALLLATGGLRGRLREPDSTGGLALAVRSEARFLRTQAEAVAARGLADSEADVGLLRLGLEGAWHQPLAEGGAVIPRLDFGLRQDAGDAEQGFGVEVRGGVRWEAPAHGVTLDLAGQTLLAHSDQGFETWGGAATVRWDPAPGSAAGPALVLRQTYGSVGAGGSPTFWTDAPVALLASPGPADLRVTADFGWGLPLTAGLGVPHVTYGWAPTSRELAFGWRLLPNRARDLTLDLTVSHREARRTAPVRRITLSLTRNW